jgi:hypothetical protein
MVGRGTRAGTDKGRAAKGKMQIISIFLNQLGWIA